MPNFQIITDSCSDFNEQMYREFNVGSAPLSVLYKGELHENFSDDASLKALYDGIRAGEMPTTSAVNPEGWTALMKPILDAGDDVLAICFASALSATCQNAHIAADELREEFPGRKIHIVDSCCATLGQGLLIIKACAKRDAGESLEAVTAWAEEAKGHVAHWITVDNLFHLKRGGRLSATTAIVGTMLNIKPLLVITREGKLISHSKARGRKAAMEAIVKKIQEHCIDRSLVTIAHADCLEDAETLAAAIKERCGVAEVRIGYIGAVIGAHTGPGAMAICFMADER